MTGRPTKCTPEVVDAIVSRIEDHYSIKAAAEAEGIDERTFQRWMLRGEDEPDSIYGTFCRGVRRGRAQAQGVALKEIRSAATGTEGPQPDWRAIDRWLVLTDPEQFGLMAQVKRKVETELTDGIERLRKGLDPEAFRRVLQLLVGPEGLSEEGAGDAASGGPTEH